MTPYDTITAVKMLSSTTAEIICRVRSFRAYNRGCEPFFGVEGWGMHIPGHASLWGYATEELRFIGYIRDIGEYCVGEQVFSGAIRRIHDILWINSVDEYIAPALLSRDDCFELPGQVIPYAGRWPGSGAKLPIYGILRPGWLEGGSSFGEFRQPPACKYYTPTDEYWTVTINVPSVMPANLVSEGGKLIPYVPTLLYDEDSELGEITYEIVVAESPSDNTPERLLNFGTITVDATSGGVKYYTVSPTFPWLAKIKRGIQGGNNIETGDMFWYTYETLNLLVFVSDDTALKNAPNAAPWEIPGLHVVWVGGSISIRDDEQVIMLH